MTESKPRPGGQTPAAAPASRTSDAVRRAAASQRELVKLSLLACPPPGARTSARRGR